MRSWLLVVMDSCRYDAYRDAQPRLPGMLVTGPRSLDSISSAIQRAHSCATWTGPSHLSILSGLLPHTAGPDESRDTPDLYRGALVHHAEMLDVPRDAIAKFAPALWLPEWLSRQGYLTAASVSMPVLNPRTPVGTGWHRFRQAHEPVEAHLREVELVRGLRHDGLPWFVMLNLCETHYPYASPHAAPDPDDPVLHGLHGAARDVDAATAGNRGDWFSKKRMLRFYDRQVQAARFVDRWLCEAVSELPRGTRVTVTADHGELLGEDGWFGHGPVWHPKVLEVPLVDGLVP